MLSAAAVLDAPDDPSGRGLLVVVAAVLLLALVSLHVRLLLRVAPREPRERLPAREPARDEVAPGTAVAAPDPGSREPVDAGPG